MFRDPKHSEVLLTVTHASFLSGHFLAFVTQDFKGVGSCFKVALMGEVTDVSHRSSCCWLGLLKLRTLVRLRGVFALEGWLLVRHRLPSNTAIFPWDT